MSTWQVWPVGVSAIGGLMVLTWAAHLVRRDASLVDRVWGLAFVVAAWSYATAAGVWSARAWLVLVLVSAWGLRLSVHLTWRNWGAGEDRRYQAMRARDPGAFPLRSLATVFLLQGAIAAVVSLPLLAATSAPAPVRLTWLDVLGTVVVVAGLVIEAVADLQLARFRADPANRDRVLERGLWRYSRHPNYFGDTVVWWGAGLIALATGAWWAAIGPALMTVLIVRVSGVALTDRIMGGDAGRSRVGYAEYVQRTNAFVPGPRKPLVPAGDPVQPGGRVQRRTG